ncbi:hypothetical protein Scep_005129 [Stephania cephalantha]|uniref:Uncharacterized protein n=1 Tax=Stephania cephalantha TaxID=152367 RepID=A0AAP0KUM7_9MAGN
MSSSSPTAASPPSAFLEDLRDCSSVSGACRVGYGSPGRSESGLSTDTGTVVAAPPPAQPDVRSGGDGRRKRPRQWRSRDRAQSTGYVASPLPVARTAIIPYAPVQSYISTPQLPAPLGSQRHDIETKGGAVAMARARSRGKRQRFGWRQSVPSGSGSQRTCWECEQPGHFASMYP